jgi:hypothetical protein
VVVASGCRVSTVVSVDATSGGHGTVTVAVTLDRGAVEELGGESSLSGQLKTADLTAAGWQVDGPRPGPDSSVVISARHPYSSSAEEAAIIESLAGSGPASTRPFQLTLNEHDTFWHVYTRLTGKVNLTCGVDCFGDQGLRSVLGSSVGVEPGPLGGTAHEQPGQLFGFTVEARLPGRVHQTNAASESAGLLRWTARLGATEELSATAQDWNWGSLILVFTLGFAAVAGTIAALLFRWRRSRQGRGEGSGDDGSGEGGKDGSGSGSRRRLRLWGGRGAHTKRRLRSGTSPEA